MYWLTATDFLLFKHTENGLMVTFKDLDLCHFVVFFGH